MSPSNSVWTSDLESNNKHAFLVNDSVLNFAWKDVSVTVDKAKKILSSASGHVGQGKIESAQYALLFHVMPS
jgi:hypothetical protein